MNSQKLRMLFALLLLAPSVFAECGVSFVKIMKIIQITEIIISVHKNDYDADFPGWITVQDQGGC